MHSFTINMPFWDSAFPVATVKVRDSFSDFLAESIMLGYDALSRPERRGITFNMECATTGAKTATVLLNREGLCIGTIVHEMRHAYFWAMSDVHARMSLDLMDEVADELFCRRLDVLINRAVAGIEAVTGPLAWKVKEPHDKRNG